MSKKFSESKERLIAIAVQFLSKPEVAKESDELKTTFLKKQKLDNQMIAEAFERVKKQNSEQNSENEKDARTDFGGNAKLKESIDEMIEKSKVNGILILRNRGISELSIDLIEKIRHVKKLIINDNPLRSISEDISKLEDLEELYAINCSLDDSKIPNSLNSLPKLRIINLSNNDLTDISPFLNLKNLEVLNLDCNCVFSIDEIRLDENQNLKFLSLVRNSLSLPIESKRKTLKIYLGRDQSCSNKKEN